MQIDFIKYKALSFVLSTVAVVAALFLLGFSSLNLGVDFDGGMVSEVKVDPDGTHSFESLSSILGPGILIQGFRGEGAVMIKLRIDQWDHIKILLDGNGFSYSKVDYVGAQVSEGFVYRSIWAIVLAFSGVYFYLLWRFNNAFALSGVIALTHDCIITVGFIVASRMEINLSVVIALLTIIGYSINDSVVIFDRIRESIPNVEANGMGFKECVNRSISSTLSRTLYTSITTLLAAITLVFFDRGQIGNFGLIVTLGIIVGTYSSIFVSAPLYLMIRAGKMESKSVTQ